MDLLTSETGIRFLIATAAVGAGLAIFAGILWFLRNRPVAPLLTRSSKERRKRLTVVDATIVDTRRRAVLIRRDNVEHLILIGGPTDLVIESGIALAPEPSASTPVPNGIGHKTAGIDYAAPATPTVTTARTRPAPRKQETAMPSEATDFTYGPEAALSAGRDYAPEPAPASPKEPENTPLPPSPEKPPTIEPADVTDENAEAIIDMMRQRLLGHTEPTSRENPLQRQTDQTVKPSVTPAADSAFSRVLDGRPQPGDLPAEQTPSVQPARVWAPPVEASPKAIKESRTENLEPAAQTRRSDAALELEVARILEQLQQRRDQ